LEYFRNGNFGTGREDFPVFGREFKVALEGWKTPEIPELLAYL